MKNLALLTALASLAPLSSAAGQFPYNRSVTSVEVRSSASQEPGHYDLRIGLQFQVGSVGTPSLDLSADLQVRVNGQLAGVLPFEAQLSLADGGPVCEQTDACSQPQMCGINSSNGFQMRCVNHPASMECFCTSDVFLEMIEVAIPAGGGVSVVIDAAAAEIAEIFLDDDRFDFDFLGANYCAVTPNSTGGPAHIWASGSASIGDNDLTLFAGPMPTNQFGIFFYGASSAQLPFGNGFRCVGGQVFRLGISSTGNDGLLSTQVDLTSPPEPAGLITAGSSQHFQAWYRDPLGGNSGFNLSDGYVIPFLP